MNRWHVLLPALLGALGLVLFGEAPGEATDVVAAQPSRARQEPVRLAADDASEALPELGDRGALYPRRASPTTSRDLFAGHSWAMPTAPAASEPPVPVAPEFPFSFIGKKREAGVWEVFLTKGETTMILREGQMAEQSYQVVRIAPPILTMMYLPMNHVYSVSIGDAE